ncbi:MAG: LolA family protein [Candidatus Zhuqueibacterota bacterium]
MSRKLVVLTGIFVLAMCALAFAQETVDDIIKKNIEARGGYDKLKAVNTVKMTGKQMMQGMEIPFTIIQKRPNCIRLEVSLQGQTMVQVFDGQNAWWINPFMGLNDPQKMPEDQARSVEEQADMDGHLVDSKDKGHTVELIGKENMEGTDVYKVKVVLKNGDVRYDLIDAEHFLEIKTIAKIDRQGTQIEAETSISDYKEVNGLMVGTAMETKVSGQTVSQITIDTIEMNVEVDDSLFKMPVKESAPETPQN